MSNSFQYSPSPNLVESDDDNTIQRCPHDRENPYSQINRDLIRDNSISPECRWLIIYLLSMKDGWKINLKQVQEHVKPHMGRDRVRKMFNEGIDAGYILREEYSKVLRREDGSYKGVFRRVRYFISEQPKFKKCLPRSDFQRAENKGAENLTDKEIESEKKEHKKELSVVGAVAPTLESLEKEEVFSEEQAPDESDLPHTAVLSQANGSKLKVTQSQLYERIIRSRCDFAADAIRYAWKCLCEYEGIVHDWWRFIEGTATNFMKKKKSKNITGDKKCLKQNSKNNARSQTSQERGSSRECKDDSLVNDSSEQASPPLVLIANLLNPSQRSKMILSSS